MKSRNLLWQIPLLLVITAPLWWRTAADLLNPETEIRNAGTMVARSFVIDGVKLIQSKDGMEEFRLNAERVASENGQKVLLFDKVEAVIFEGEERVDISGREAVFDTEQQILTLLSDVKLHSTDGYSLETMALRYLAKYKRVKSAAPLVFTGNGLSISGNTFHYDLNSGNFRVGSRVVCNLW